LSPGSFEPVVLEGRWIVAGRDAGRRAASRRSQLRTGSPRVAVNKTLPQLAEKADKASKARQAEIVIRFETERVRGDIKSGRKLQVPLVHGSRLDTDK
jgi:hypothetical protein